MMASLRVERMSARMELVSTILTVVANSTPASAASGIFETIGAAAKTAISSTIECEAAARRELAPARTFTAVRAMAAVAGMPPKIGAARLASPWPNSSRSGSCCSLTLMPSATVAQSRLSKAASAATASAAVSSIPIAETSTNDSDGVGRPAGRSPSGTSCIDVVCATMVASAIPISENGQRVASARQRA